jgi:hypothetical protein
VETTMVKAIDLVFDWNLWPRQSAQRLDSTNVARMREALRSGFPLPPILVSKSDMRIVDGFHRTQSVLDVFGDDGEIEAILKEYQNEAEMYLDAGATNCRHGLPMSPKDRAHFISRCRKMKCPWPAIAEALSMDPKRVKAFVESRTATTPDGETVPLSAGARSLAGLILTPAQEHFAKTANGCVPEMYVSMLLNALRADGMILTDRTIARLQELRDEIDRILDEAA